MAIFTDGILFTSDVSLAELDDFARRVGAAQSQRRINRWAIYYEYAGAAQREQGKRLGAQHVQNTQAVWARWRQRRASNATTK